MTIEGSPPAPAAPQDAPTWGIAHVAGLFRGRWKLVTAFVLSAVGRSVSSAAVLLLIQRFLSGALGQGAGHGAGPSAPSASGVARVEAALGGAGTLWAVALVLLVVQVAGSLCAYVNYVAQQHVAKVVELGTMEILVRHLLKLSLGFFDRQSHGDIIETMLTDVGHLRTMVRSMFNILFEGLLALGLVAAVVRISPKLALLAFVVVPAAALPLYVVANKTLKRSLHVRTTGYVLSDIILQVLRGIRVIKIFQAEEAQARESVDKGNVYHEALITPHPEPSASRPWSWTLIAGRAGRGGDRLSADTAR